MLLANPKYFSAIEWLLDPEGQRISESTLPRIMISKIKCGQKIDDNSYTSTHHDLWILPRRIQNW